MWQVSKRVIVGNEKGLKKSKCLFLSKEYFPCVKFICNISIIFDILNTIKINQIATKYRFMRELFVTHTVHFVVRKVSLCKFHKRNLFANCFHPSIKLVSNKIILAASNHISFYALYNRVWNQEMNAPDYTSLSRQKT